MLSTTEKVFCSREIGPLLEVKTRGPTRDKLNVTSHAAAGETSVNLHLTKKMLERPCDDARYEISA